MKPALATQAILSFVFSWNNFFIPLILLTDRSKTVVDSKVSTLGAEMDISISVASAISEVGLGNPSLGRMALFRAGMNVGRDMMGTMANTLILAFAGTSLNAVILIYSLQRSAYQILNSNALTIEIAQSLSAGLAVILTVPAVAYIAAALGTRRPQ